MRERFSFWRGIETSTYVDARKDQMLDLPNSGNPAQHPLLHSLTVEETFRRLESSSGGLSSDEAARRLEQFGPNELQAQAHVSPWAILLDQFKNVLIIILLLATALSAFLGHGVEAIAITVIVLFAVVLGFIQEFRAKRAIEALREMAAPAATVIRDGR